MRRPAIDAYPRILIEGPQTPSLHRSPTTVEMQRRRAARIALSLALLLAACGTQAPSVVPSGSAAVSPSADAEPSEPASAEASPTGPSAFAGAWADVTADTIGTTEDWTNKVELADIDGDGAVDILFANGGTYETPGTPVASRVFRNLGDGAFEDTTDDVLGEHALLTRVIKVADLDGDADADILLGTTYQTQSRLLLNDGAGGWTDATATNLPAVELSVGDLEVGDVDGDRDLDIVLAHWGEGSPMANDGGRVQLWLNDGAATFTDATADRMPEVLIGFSWDLELVDVDNDWDLDAAISCKQCPTSRLFVNDGAGNFTDETDARLPAFANNYEFAPIDLDGDGFLDLVTINDGDPTARGLGEHVFRNDATGAFTDATPEWWGADANLGWDDNVVVALDVESDGDADFVIGSLDGPDRLLVNDGSGVLTVATDVFDADPSGGTLGMALADLNGDRRVDVVESQGEVPGHEDERVYFATEILAPDSAAPVVRAAVIGESVLARAHDNRTPNMPHDWQSVVARWDGGETPMAWYGENLFWANVPADASGLEVCATDAADNEACGRLE